MQALSPKDAPKLCTVSCAVDPPSMKWSDLKYVIWLKEDRYAEEEAQA